MKYKKEEIFNNGTAIVFYWPEVKLIENKWLKKIALDSQAYRTPFLKAIEFAKNENVLYYLSDIRNQGVVPVKEKTWFRTEMFPKAIDVGVKFGAVVTTANVFKTYYMNAIIKAGNMSNFPVKTFNDYDKAISWLLQHNIHNQ
jgi:hypothetical protein